MCMRQLPKGTVTFVFTDIEGSTRLLHTLGDRYRQALEQHRAILRAAFTSHGGVEVDTQGDSFFVAFSTPRGALLAAIRGQRALAEHPWPQGGELRVRMGIHTGTPEVTEEGYVGSDVHLGARICAAAWGGQILLSPTTAAHVSTSSDDISLRSLGAHALKDIDERIELFLIIGPGLRADFPPLRTTGSHPTNLPPRLQPLIGRDTELAALTELLARDDVSLVTLVGPGGTGKTRLALASGAELVSSFADGVFFVDLSALADPALVIGAIAQTLSLRETPGRSLADRLTDHLSSKQTLLILDNLEQVIDAATDIATLLTTAPDLKVLATSREALRITGERVVSLAPLELPSPDHHSPQEVSRAPAVALFVERAHAVKAGFFLTPDNAADVAAVCRRLDGLPLALELAAARINLLSPSALLSRLDSGLKVLTSGRRDASARQRTLRGAIEWSYGLLTPDEQTLFRRLGVFAGGWSLDAAEQICDRGDLGTDLLEGLASLVDKSLVQAVEGDEERFTMLETIREFASDKLQESGEVEEIRRGHAEFFRALAEEAEQHIQRLTEKQWLDRLELELGNIRVALDAYANTDAVMRLRLASSVFRMLWVRGHLREGRRWLSKALADVPQHTTLRGKGLRALSAILRVQGDDAQAVAAAEESLAISQKLGDDAATGSCLVTLGIAEEGAGHWRAALSRYEQAAALLRASASESDLAVTLNNMGNLAVKSRQPDRARTLFQESLEIQERHGNVEGMTISLLNLGLLALDEANHARAYALISRALAHASDLGHQELLASCLDAMAALAVADGNPAEASRLLDSAALVRRRWGVSLDPDDRAVRDRAIAAIEAAMSDRDDGAVPNT